MTFPVSHRKRGVSEFRSGAMVQRDFLLLCVLFASPLLCSATAHAQGATPGTGRISGYVYCADTNLPARFAVVRVQSVSSIGSLATLSDEAPTTAARVTTGLDGGFFIDGLTSGNYLVLASMRGYMYPLAQFAWSELKIDSVSPAPPVKKRLSEALPQVSVSPGQTASIVIHLERGAEISGRVTYDDGSPVVDGHITIYRFSKGSNEWQEVEMPPDDSWLLRYTDDRGSFRLPGMPRGRYLVSVRVDGGGGSNNAILGGTMRTASDGSHPGHLEVYFGDTVRQNVAIAVEVAVGEHRPGVDIQVPLSRLRKLSGTITAESDGHPIATAMLQLKFADDGTLFIVAHPGHDGTFQTPFVPDGDYILAISAAPDGDPQIPHAYEGIERRLSVSGDSIGIAITLPDKISPPSKASP